MKTILVINSGSSTIKFGVFAIEEGKPSKLYGGVVDKILFEPEITIKSSATNNKVMDQNIPVQGSKESYYEQVIDFILAWMEKEGFEVIGAGHRIVHSGAKYSAPVVLNDEILEYLATLNPIIPLHQPHNLNGVRIMQKKLPNIPQIGCFDTGFHATCDPVAQTFAIPLKYRDEGVRRYGFHGLSYEYIASVLPKFVGDEKAKGKWIVCHLGNGATMCALENLKSVATSIGFSAIGGLPMGTRADSLDPGLMLYLMKEYKMDVDQMLDFIYKKCGLKGVSELSSDMRDLHESDSPKAKLAVDIFVHQVANFIGTLSAELQGCDGIVFTAGIGENDSIVREAVCERAGWLGFELDKTKNDEFIRGKFGKISTQNSKDIWVVPTDEELMIAKHALSFSL